MAETSGERPRVKRPQGYYSKAQRTLRSIAFAARKAAAAERRAHQAENRKTRDRMIAQQEGLRVCAASRLVAAREDRPRPPVPSRPKKQKRDRRSELQKKIQARAEANRAAWASRHPATAGAERQLRKERAQLVDKWKHKNDGTPETHEHHARHQQGALAKLHETGAIDHHQLAAAVMIAETYWQLGADVSVRTASLETKVDVTRHGDGSFHENLGRVRREVAYTKWRAQVAGPIGAVLEMIVGDGPAGTPLGFTIVARRYRMHNRRAKRLLTDALDLWIKILRETCKWLDPATLLAAQAGL